MKFMCIASASFAFLGLLSPTAGGQDRAPTTRPATAPAPVEPRNAQPEPARSQPETGTVTRIDSNLRTITVRLQDAKGKNYEKTLRLTDGVALVDGSGKAVAIETLHSGDQVQLIEEKGKVRRIRTGHPGGRDADATGTRPPERSE
jgi:hypothetical protein